MRKLAALAPILLLVGCSDPDPATSQLRPGQRVIVPPSDLTNDNRTQAGIRGEFGYPIDNRLPASRWPYLYTGDEGVVLADPGKDPDDNRTTARRDRHVAIEVTRHQAAPGEPSFVGLKCQAKRLDLRPIP